MPDLMTREKRERGGVIARKVNSKKGEKEEAKKKGIGLNGI